MLRLASLLLAACALLLLARALLRALPAPLADVSLLAAGSAASRFSSARAGLLAYSQPLVNGSPEFECSNAYSPCAEEDRTKGPPLHMLQPGRLSQADADMLLAFRRFSEPREEQAARVPYEKRKVAFLFLTKGPLPLAALWERFFKGHEGRFSVFVHTNPGYKYPPAAPDIFRRSQIRSESVAWGSPTMIDAERRLLANALADPANHRFVLLSESCIPVKGFNFTWKYLMGTRFSFVANYHTSRIECAGRFHRLMAPAINASQWRKGLQWFSATRRHVNMIIEDNEIYSKFEKYCRGDKWHHHCYADEHYIQTLLSIKDPQWIANRTITFTDFSQWKEHPRTFFKEEIDENLLRYITEPHHLNPRNIVTLPCSQGGIKRSCYLFARKFDPSTLSKLLSFSDDVLDY